MNVNNWQTWRLAIRATAAAMLKDSIKIRETKMLVEAHLARNLDADGSGFDFKQRDALHYHTYNLEAWLQILYAIPDINNKKKIINAFLFLKPCYSGTQKHVEFLKSEIPFDKKRREADIQEYLNLPWDPCHANSLLRVARCLDGSLRDWTKSLDRNNEFSPRLKLIAALSCETD